MGGQGSAHAKGMKNLIPIHTLPRDQHLALCSKGGKTKSPKRGIANRLRRLRKRGLTDSTSYQIWEALTVPELSAMDQYMYLKRLEGIVQGDPRGMAVYARLMADWHKLHHGDKTKQESKTVNIQPVTINIGVYKDETE